jgi:DNA-binding Lrp family transcriptional regulator
MSGDIKKRLLQVLEQNHKITTKTLATMFEITETEVKEIIKELEEGKVILGYVTLIDWEKMNNGDDSVTAIIDVKVTPQRDVGFDTIAERICRFPEVKGVYLMSGGYDLSVVIEGTSMKKVAFFVADRLATLENVQSTATHFVLKKYKQDGIIFDDNKKDRRLVVSP